MTEGNKYIVEICLKCGEETNCESTCIDCFFCRQWAHGDCFGIEEATIDNFRSILRHQGFKWICPECNLRQEGFIEIFEEGDKSSEVQTLTPVKRNRQRTIFSCESSSRCRKRFPNNEALRIQITAHSTGDIEQTESGLKDENATEKSVKTSNLQRTVKKKASSSKKSRKLVEEDHDYSPDSSVIHKSSRNSGKTKNIKCKKKIISSLYCRPCSQVFPDKDSLKNHQDSHEGEKPFSCSVCDKTFKNARNLQQHYNSHVEEKQFKCDFCEKCYHWKKDYLSHRTQHTGEKPFLCDMCDQSFSSSYLLSVHRKSQHSVTLQCETCDATFEKALHLKRHQKMEHGTPCYICGTRFLDKEERSNHEKSHDPSEKPVFICDICGQTFSRKRVLLSHHQLHTLERPVLCDICGKSFPNRSTLRTHQDAHAEGRFGCNLCDKKFRRRRYLMEHMQTHSGEKQYLCTTCGKHFMAMRTLQRHQKIHLGEKPFSCEVCFKRFTFKQYLTQHMQQKGVHAAYL